MKRGYIKLWRKSFDSGMHKNHKMWTLWTWILANVTHKERPYIIGSQKVILMPGQIVIGRNVLSEKLGMSVQNIRTCLLLLKNFGNLTIKSTNRYSLLTVVNWELYQSENQQLTSKSTSIQPATNQQLTTKQEGKECKELKSTPSGEVFNLPSKEELSESSKKKLRIDTDNLLKKLYDKKIFGKAHAFVNAMRKKQKNDRAILHALSRCYLKGINGKFKSDSDAWAYCQKIMNVENGNYNESDHQKTV